MSFEWIFSTSKIKLFLEVEIKFFIVSYVGEGEVRKGLIGSNRKDI